jgi:hypothetical protein
MPIAPPVLWKFEVSPRVKFDFEIKMMGIGVKATSSFGAVVKCARDSALQYKNVATSSEGSLSAGEASIWKRDVASLDISSPDSKTTVKSLRVSRKWSTELPGFGVTDPPAIADQPDYTFAFELKLQTPLRTQIKMKLPGAKSPKPSSADYEMIVEHKFDYHPERIDPHSEQQVDISKYFKKVLSDSRIPGKITGIEGSIDYTLTKKKLSLEYGEDTSRDVLEITFKMSKPDPKTKIPPFKPFDQHVGSQGGTWRIHANMSGKVLVDGKNYVDIRSEGSLPSIESPFKIWRYVRSWQIDGDGRVAKSPILNWHPDAKDTVTPLKDWLDNPSTGFVLEPKNWESAGTLGEFLVGVKNFPEFGLVYAAFAIEIRKGEYRITYAPPSEKLTIAEAEAIFFADPSALHWKYDPSQERSKGWTKVPPLPLKTGTPKTVPPKKPANKKPTPK